MADKGTIVAHACCRVDLAGGTLDIWPLYLFHPGAVTVNFGVNILTRCRIAPLAGKRIHLKSIDISVDKPNRIILADVLIERFRKQYPLLPTRSFNVAH